MPASSSTDLSRTPVVPPPAGQTSNFDRELSSVQIATIAVFSVTYFLASISMVIRYMTSAYILRKWESDTLLITLAWLAALGYFISVCFCMKYGWGSHAWDISMAEIKGYYRCLLPTTLFYMWSPTLTKLSILVVLYRISPALWYRIGVYAISASLLTYTIVFTAMLSGPCNPVDSGSGTCLQNLAYAQVALNITTDLLIILLPLPVLYPLQIPFRKKLVIGGILGLGSSVLIASIARAPYVKVLATSLDFSRKQAQAGVWSLVELNFGILCNNLMRLKPFLRAYLPKLLAMLGLSSGSESAEPQGDSSEGNRYWAGGREAKSYRLHSVEAENSGQNHHLHTDEQGDRTMSRQHGSIDSILQV